MNISSLTITRSKFMSKFESFESTDILGDTYPALICTGNTIENIDTKEAWGMNLVFKDLKAMFMYFLGIHSLEPILDSDSSLIKLTDLNPGYTYTFAVFNGLTTINNKESFIFRPINFIDDMLYAYKDIAYQGDISMYKPFGHTANKSLDTRLTVDISGMRSFFKQSYLL